MSYFEKHGAELHDYIVDTKPFYVRSLKSVQYQANGVLNNIPFTQKNRKVYLRVLSLLTTIEAAYTEVLELYGGLE